MKMLDLQQTADYLENVSTIQTVDVGHALIHLGETMAGIKFVLVNNMFGQSALTESM